MASLRDFSRADLIRLATALESGKLRPPYSAALIGRYTSRATHALDTLNRLHTQGIPPEHVGFTARLLAEEKAHTQAVRDRVDVVWTGPEVVTSGSRDSATVARELLAQAHHSVMLASYTIDPKAKNVEKLLGHLAARMGAVPELEVQLFINVGRRWINGVLDSRDDAVIIDEFTRRLIARWPGTRLPRVYYDPRALQKARGPRACLHAKVVVIDHKKVLVTSANLTEAAHERNIEAGVLIDDADIAKAFERQFRSLVDARALVPLPELE